MMPQVSFAVAIEHALARVEFSLFDFVNIMDHRSVGNPLSEKLKQELERYYKTGNCSESTTPIVCPNPTLLDPVTGQWYVHYTACPLDGYLPLPWRELADTPDHQQGLILRYCQTELRKELTAFRNRSRNFKFSFYSSDALAFCYKDSPLKFDVISASDLGDVVGLVNVLNAATRRLRSAQSLLITETVQWYHVAPTVSQYLQEVLCCPLSLIPTIYGVRLIDSIDRGRETPPKLIAQTTRIAWKRALPFEGVHLVLSPNLERSLKQLKDQCFRLSSAPFPSVCDVSGRCGTVCYSQLTFRYVVADMIQRGVFQDPAALMSSAFSRLPPVVNKSLEVTKAWADQRPVWRVSFPYHLNLTDPVTRLRIFLFGPPALRLIFVPHFELQSVFAQVKLFADDTEKLQSVFFALDSTTHHFFDNLDVNVNGNDDGYIDMTVSFLLHDRSLLETHLPLVTTLIFNGPTSVARLSDELSSVVTFKGAFPLKKPPSLLPKGSPGSKQWIVAESCKESEEDYNIRFKVHRSADQKQPSGNWKFV